MKIIWDENKNLINQTKHRVSFDTAQCVFDDPRQERIEGEEQRWQTIGLVHGVVVLLVAHTVTEANGDETIRIISARKADKNERRIYEQA